MPTPGEVVVLSVGIERAPDAFAIARERRKSGQIVRVIAPGATLEGSWPAWVRAEHPDLRLTEPGAFNHEPSVVSTWDLQEDLRAFLDRTFAGAFKGRPADLLFTSACARFLQTPIATYPIARALAETWRARSGDAPATFVCLDRGFHTINGGWDPSLFEQIVTAQGIRVESPEEERPRGARARLLGATTHAPWPARALGVGALALAGSVLKQARGFLASRRSQAEVRSIHSKERPRVWLTIIPDWARVNSIAVEAFGLPLLAEGERLGVIFVDNLRRGVRSETNMKATEASSVTWPGLGALQPFVERGQCVIEQAVQPAALADFATTLARGALASGKALSRLARDRYVPVLNESARIDLGPNLWPLLSLATLDVLRGVLAERASESFVAKTAFGPNNVAIVSCSSTVSLAAVDVALQRAGALTLNSPDGSGSDTWTGVGSTVSSARVVWTHADARSIGRSCDRVIVAGMPLRMSNPARQSRPRRILLLNNHGHREFSVGGVFRERAFQEELLRLPEELRKRGFADLAFRWRPHPAATQDSIDHGMAVLHDVDLSTNRPLHEDATWADLIVCGYSTSIIEVLFSGAPVFVQARSELLGLPAHDFLQEPRVFFYADEGAEKIGRYLSAWTSVNTRELLAPEYEAKERLFGPTQTPLPTTEALRVALDEARPNGDPEQNRRSRNKRQIRVN